MFYDWSSRPFHDKFSPTVRSAAVPITTAGGHTQSQVLCVSLNVSLNPKQHGCYSGGRFGCSMLILCLFERNLKIFEFCSLPLKNAVAALLCADEGITSPLSLSEAADRKTTNRHDSNVCAIIGSSVGALNK